MNIQMPEMDGYQSNRALRETACCKPIIALTAHAIPKERAQTLAAGCNGHPTKPIVQAELISEIARLVLRGPLKPIEAGKRMSAMGRAHSLYVRAEPPSAPY